MNIDSELEVIIDLNSPGIEANISTWLEFLFVYQFYNKVLSLVVMICTKLLNLFPNVRSFNYLSYVDSFALFRSPQILDVNTTV